MTFITVLLLIAITWLLWQIHQDLQESNGRQRNLKTAMARLANQVESLLEARDTPTGKSTSRTTGKRGSKDDATG